MKRSILISICLFCALFSIDGQVKIGFKGAFYYGDLPYNRSLSDIHHYCESNGFIPTKNYYDSTLVDYKISHYKAPSFAVDITIHTIEVKWIFNQHIETFFFKKALMFTRTYYYNKLSPDYPQDKYDSYLNEHYTYYVKFFSKKSRKHSSGELADSQQNIIGEHTIFKLKSYKKNKYYLEIIRLNDSIVKNLIRVFPE